MTPGEGKQVQKGPVPPLQGTCLSQARKMLRAGSEQRQALAWVDVNQGDDGLTGTGDNVACLADNLFQTPAINHYNYWSRLASQVEEQDEPEFPTHKKEKLSAILPGPSNKIAAHWARKIANCKAHTGILDTGATSGAGRPEDTEFFE